MRIRRYLIGVSAGLVSALAFSSVASADVVSVTPAGSGFFPAKQDKKVHGPVSVRFVSTDTHAGDLPCPLGTANSLSCSAFPPSTQSNIDYPNDLKFTPGSLVDCNLASLSGKGTAGARASCPRSIVGQGTVTQRFSDGRIINGVLTAFNGAPSGGNPSIYAHVELPGVVSKPILQITLSGGVARVLLPPVPGSVADNFTVSLNKIVVGKKRNKKTGKVQKLFYTSAKCSRGSWAFNEVVTYGGGIKTLTSPTVTQKCTPKKKKK